jgi:transposase
MSPIAIAERDVIPSAAFESAIFYVLRTGCPWRYLPSNFPPWQTVFYHFRRGSPAWTVDGAVRHRVNSSLAGYAASISGDMRRTSFMNTSSRLVPNATDLHETQPYPLVLKNITP